MMSPNRRRRCRRLRSHTFAAPTSQALALPSTRPLRAGMSHHMQSLAMARSLSARNHTAHLLLPDYDFASLQKRGKLGGWVTPIVFPTPPGTDDDFMVGWQAGLQGPDLHSRVGARRQVGSRSRVSRSIANGSRD